MVEDPIAYPVPLRTVIPAVIALQTASHPPAARPLDRIPPDALLPRPAFNRHAHIGVHPQRQPGLNWIGIVLPVGKLTADQMRGVARLAGELGDGDIRLTVWQNLLISGVPLEQVEKATDSETDDANTQHRRH